MIGDDDIIDHNGLWTEQDLKKMESLKLKSAREALDVVLETDPDEDWETFEVALDATIDGVNDLLESFSESPFVHRLEQFSDRNTNVFEDMQIPGELERLRSLLLEMEADQSSSNLSDALRPHA